MTHELILHHYDFSSYSEKVRLVLGLKGLIAYERVALVPDDIRRWMDRIAARGNKRQQKRIDDLKTH